MATIRAYLITAGLTDVGYQFYTQNSPIGSRTQTGVVDEGDGYYSVSGVTLQGDHVRWDSTGTSSAKAREDITLSVTAETVATNLDATISSRSTTDLDEIDGIETGITPRQALRAAVAVLVGQATGGGTTSIAYLNPSGGITRVTLTVDSNGNRSASSLNL